MAEVNLKEILADMIYDQPREKVVEALNIVHSVYDKCKNTMVHYTESEKWKSKYNIKLSNPSEILLNYGYVDDDFRRLSNPKVGLMDGYFDGVLRYLKDQQKFLSRKLAWIDKGMQEI